VTQWRRDEQLPPIALDEVVAALSTHGST